LIENGFNYPQGEFPPLAYFYGLLPGSVAQKLDHAFGACGDNWLSRRHRFQNGVRHFLPSGKAERASPQQP